MSDRYPPEPWYLIRYENVDYSRDSEVSLEHSGNGTVFEIIDKDLAERIAICVNACSGVSSRDLLEGKAQIVRNIPSRQECEERYQREKQVRRDFMKPPEELFGQDDAGTLPPGLRTYD